MNDIKEIKIKNYQGLAWEIKQLWNMPVVIEC